MYTVIAYHGFFLFQYAIKMLIHHGEHQLKQLQQNIAFSRWYKTGCL